MMTLNDVPQDYETIRKYLLDMQDENDFLSHHLDMLEREVDELYEKYTDSRRQVEELLRETTQLRRELRSNEWRNIKVGLNDPEDDDE